MSGAGGSSTEDPWAPRPTRPGGTDQPPPRGPHPQPTPSLRGRPAGNGVGVAALVFGVLGAVLGFAIIGVVPALLAVVLGAVGRARARRGAADNGGVALAGLLLGLLGVAAAVAVSIVIWRLLGTEVTRYDACLRGATTSGQQEECRQRLRHDIERRFNLRPTAAEAGATTASRLETAGPQAASGW